MLLKDFRRRFTNELNKFYPQTEIDSFFFLLIEDIVQLKRIDLALNTNLELTSANLEILQKALTRLKNQEPIQYILGKTEFFGLPFLVNKHTLIPRPETEELVDWIITDVKKSNKKTLSILDIGTGSGCIAISLAKNLPEVQVIAIDISNNTLLVAKQNAELNNVTINFVQKDILTINSLDKQFDIIVSNPPYVRKLEKKEILPNVLEHEPHLALFVDDDKPLIFYEKIAELAKNHLAKDGALYVEINQYLGEETLKMLQQKGFKTELKKDIFKNDRMIKSFF